MKKLLLAAIVILLLVNTYMLYSLSKNFERVMRRALFLEMTLDDKMDSLDIKVDELIDKMERIAP